MNTTDQQDPGSLRGESELLPCPFCLSENVSIISDCTDAEVFCEDCSGGMTRVTKAEAIEAWNRRAPFSTQPEREAAEPNVSKVIALFEKWNREDAGDDLSEVLALLLSRPAAPAGIPREKVEALTFKINYSTEQCNLAVSKETFQYHKGRVDALKEALALLALPTDPQEPAQAKEVRE